MIQLAGRLHLQKRCGVLAPQCGQQRLTRKWSFGVHAYGFRQPATHDLPKQMLAEKPRQRWKSEKIVHQSKIEKRITHFQRLTREARFLVLEHETPLGQKKRTVGLWVVRMDVPWKVVERTFPARSESQAGHQFRLDPFGKRRGQLAP